MAVLCESCGKSLHWNYAYENYMKDNGQPVVCWECIVKYKKYRKYADEFLEWFKGDEVMLKREGLTPSKAFALHFKLYNGKPIDWDSMIKRETNNHYKPKKEMNQLIPYSIGILFTPEEDLKKLSTKALSHRIKYLRELVIISHKNGYKPPKNIVAELNELIAIKKGETNGK